MEFRGGEEDPSGSYIERMQQPLGSMAQVGHVSGSILTHLAKELTSLHLIPMQPANLSTRTSSGFKSQASTMHTQTHMHVHEHKHVCVHKHTYM